MTRSGCSLTYPRAAAGHHRSAFPKNLRLIQADLADYLSGDLWYQGYAAGKPCSTSDIGYFSPEFGH